MNHEYYYWLEIALSWNSVKLHIGILNLVQKLLSLIIKLLRYGRFMIHCKIWTSKHSFNNERINGHYEQHCKEIEMSSNSIILARMCFSIAFCGWLWIDMIGIDIKIYMLVCVLSVFIIEKILILMSLYFQPYWACIFTKACKNNWACISSVSVP